MFRTIQTSESVLNFTFKIEYTTPLLELRYIEVSAKTKNEAYRKFVPLAFDFLRGNLDLLFYAVKNRVCNESFWNLLSLKEALSKEKSIYKYCQLVQQHDLKFNIPTDQEENKNFFTNTVQNIETVLPQIISTINHIDNEYSLSIRRICGKTRPTLKGNIRNRFERRKRNNPSLLPTRRVV